MGLSPMLRRALQQAAMSLGSAGSALRGHGEPRPRRQGWHFQEVSGGLGEVSKCVGKGGGLGMRWSEQPCSCFYMPALGQVL